MLFSSFLAEARQAATLYHLANVVLSIAFLVVRVKSFQLFHIISSFYFFQVIPQLCELILVPEEDGECTVTSVRELLMNK